MSKIFNQKKRGIGGSFLFFLFWGRYFLGQLFTWWGDFRTLLSIYFFLLLIIGYWNVSNFLALSKKESGLFMIVLLLLTLLIVGMLWAYVLMVYWDVSYFLSWVLDRAFFKAFYNDGTCKSQDCFFEALFVVFYLLGGIVSFWISFLIAFLKKTRK